MAATTADLSSARQLLRTVSLLDVEPELGEWIAPSERDPAARATRVVAVEVVRGPFEPSEVFAAGQDGFGALVISGLICREVWVSGQPAMRLFGPGDVFLDEPGAAETLEPEGAWSASLTTRLAILDDRLLVAVRRWPRLMRGICARLQQCHETTLVQLSISHQPRVEDRVVALFRLLAARWGRMTAEGLVVPIGLTHEAIGRMIGARRPTVTLALRELGRDGRLQRDDGGRWLLGPSITPPGDFNPLVNGQVPRLVVD
jgi:CRP/FNR family transcriptional regulator, cyclic AMP receptor protein